MVAVEKNSYPVIPRFIHPKVRLSVGWKPVLGTWEDKKCLCACVFMFREGRIIAYICSM